MSETKDLGTCCGGLEALKVFDEMEQLIPEEKKNPKLLLKIEQARNRFRYEVAKGYGVPKKINKGVKAWHSDFYTCGKCGAGAGAANHEYCPNCGTRYLMNSHTKEKLEENGFRPEEIMARAEQEKDMRTSIMSCPIFVYHGGTAIKDGRCVGFKKDRNSTETMKSCSECRFFEGNTEKGSDSKS